MSEHIEKDSISGTETTGHEWDGIKELNTPLPKWWLYILYATIVFAIGYSVVYPSFPIPWNGYFEGTTGYTNRIGLESDLKQAAAQFSGKIEQVAKTDISAIAKNPALLEFSVSGGRSAFAQNCVGCHGAGGQGNLGYPNLTDDVWLWGGTLDQIYQTIQFGVRNSNPNTHQGVLMPSWGEAEKNPPQLLTSAQINDVASYVLSLNGKNDDAQSSERGMAIFTENCVACHGEDAHGNQDMGAPPLNAGIWLYGGDKSALVKTITHGRGGVMPAWSERLDPATVKMLALYVHQLGGGK